jgi:hypothetical protein
MENKNEPRKLKRYKLLQLFELQPKDHFDKYFVRYDIANYEKCLQDISQNT